MFNKQFIITSITLGIIAAASALFIGCTNLITKDRIAQNEKNKINSGISEIFGISNFDFEENDISSSYSYVDTYYRIVDKNNNNVGHAFKTTGSNMYGKISLLAGFDYDTLEFIKIYMIVNEQTYASTLVDNYVTPLNNNTRDLDDVQCGATYGAKLVRDMIKEATEAVEKIGK